MKTRSLLRIALTLSVVILVCILAACWWWALSGMSSDVGVAWFITIFVLGSVNAALYGWWGDSHGKASH